MKTGLPAGLRISAAMLIVTAYAAAQAAEESPRSLVQGRKGLCLVVAGADSGKLVTELAAGSEMLVHAVVADDDSLSKVRSEIERAGLAGQATVEKVPFRPFPIPNDLANVVIEDRLESGLTKEELLRVTAPFGKLCTRSGVGWSVTSKPVPADTDDWPQVHHGADLNGVSGDKRLVKGLQTSIGLRWLEGIPVNATGCSGTTAWVVSGGRCYTYGVNEVENTPPAALSRGSRYGLVFSRTQYVSARDAFNGLPLWKVATGTQNDGNSIVWTSESPLVADAERVWAGTDKEVLCLDGPTGKTLAVCKTTYRPWRLILHNGVLLSAGWEQPTRPQFTWMPGSAVGTVDAFDALSGRKKWSVAGASVRIAAAGETVYLLNHVAGAPTKSEIVAVDFATGNVRWRKAASELGAEKRLDISNAGDGFISLLAMGAGKGAIRVLASADGKVLWESACSNSGTWTPLADGLLWINGKRVEPLTGKAKGSFRGAFYMDAICRSVQPFIPPFYGFADVGVDGKSTGAPVVKGNGFRTACGQGFVPAYGMVYIPQTYCKCVPGQVYGMMAMGESPSWPGAAEFAAARPIEKGPAFGQTGTPAGGADWPTYRGDSGRASSTGSEAPGKLKELWRLRLAGTGGPVAQAWRPQLASALTAPVVAGQTLLAASTDGGQLFGIDASSGRKLWTQTLPSRVDSPPTVHDGLALVGCHDGWCYAFAVADGRLAWRTRVAPLEQRMIAFGKVESSWPTVGSVLVSGNTAYVTAGRTSDFEGGVAMVALDAATGQMRWAVRIEDGFRINDLLSMRAGELAWHYLRFNPADGKRIAPTTMPDLRSFGGGSQNIPGGILDGTWTQSINRRSRGAYTNAGVTADMMAWNADVIATEKGLFSSKDGVSIWKSPLPANLQAEAIVIAGSKVVYAGADRQRDPQTYFLATVNLKDGQRLAEISLEARPTLNGLAVTGGRIYVSLCDGQLLCLGQ